MSHVKYRERVTPSVWMYLAGALVIPAVIVVFLPINVIVGVILGVAIYAGYLAMLLAGSPVIEVTATTLRVGSAQIPLRFVGTASANDSREQARAAAGPGLDARAWTTLRGWVSTSARVNITDTRDPIPYWLFSTRHPREFVRALEDAVAALPTRA